jgi:hypothetical protein
MNESLVILKTSSDQPFFANAAMAKRWHLALWSRSHLKDRRRFLSRPNVGICTRMHITLAFLILKPAPSLWAWHTSSEAGTGTFGKYSNSLISRTIGGKIPGRFNSSLIKSYLSKTWGLGPSRSDGVLLLLLGITLELAMRFRSEAEAKAWLDGVAVSYLFPSLIFYIGSKLSALLVTPGLG